jgi:hypothetical protein
VTSVVKSFLVVAQSRCASVSPWWVLVFGCGFAALWLKRVCLWLAVTDPPNTPTYCGLTYIESAGIMDTNKKGSD